MPPKEKERTLNLNTVLLVFSLLGGLGTLVKYILPLAVLPEKAVAVDAAMKSLRADVDTVGKTQAVQTDVLQRMAAAVEKQDGIRRDVDASKVEMIEIKRRLDRLEAESR